MTQVTHDNTKVRNTRSRTFGPCTLNNYTDEELASLQRWLTDDCMEFHINREQGENGTPHLQYCMRFKNARTFSSVSGFNPRAHIEVCKNWNAVKNYCRKADTATHDTISKTPFQRRSIKDPLEGKTLYPWQSRVLSMIEQEPNDRSILWLWEPDGNVGKTTIAKHLCIKYPNKVLYMGGKAADVKYGIKSFLDNEENDLLIVIFDYVRSNEDYISYEAIESIKNGIFYNSKYESEMVVFNSPHVICFANFAPETYKLSKDRWIVEQIGGDTALPV